MNINEACGCYAIDIIANGSVSNNIYGYAIISRKVRYLPMSRFRIPSFTASAYLVTESYGGKVLDSFSIKLLNRFTYLPETQAPGLFEQALAINLVVFTVSSTQALSTGF